MQPTTFAVWRDALVADHSPDNALYPMLPLLLTGDIEEQLLLAPEIFEIEHTRAGLAGTGITCPPLDGALLDVYLAAMVRSGFLPSPATRAAANVDVEEDGTAPNELVHASAALVRAERNDATCPTTLTTRARRNGNTGGSRHDATPGGSR